MNEAPFPHFIDPYRVAARIADARYGEDDRLAAEIAAHPRLCEAMYFIAWASNGENYPGGLNRFAVDFLAVATELLGPEDMSVLESRRSGIESREAFAAKLPCSLQNALQIAAYDDDEVDFIPDAISDYLPNRSATSYSRMKAMLNDDTEELERIKVHEVAERAVEEKARREKIKAATRARHLALRELTPHKVRAACAGMIAQRLPEWLGYVCHRKGASLFEIQDERNRAYDDGAVKCFHRLGEALFRFLDRWQAQRRAEIAETEVTREVFKWLGVCAATGDPVRIEGNSRFGKTEAINTWVEMQPGRARLVDTPHSGGEGDLLRAVAQALGMRFNPKARTTDLRRDVDYVLRHSSITLVFDEAQWLLPEKINRNTEPSRLNFVRRRIVDQRIPAAFISTPQTYQTARTRLVRGTGYAMEQWDERILKTVRLPDKVSDADLLAIARLHFPRLSADHLGYVVSLVSITERNYVSDVAKIARLANQYAIDAGRPEITLAEIDAAVADVLPAIRQVPRRFTPRPPRPSRGAHEPPGKTSPPPRRTSPARASFLQRLRAPCSPSAIPFHEAIPILSGAADPATSPRSSRPRRGPSTSRKTGNPLKKRGLPFSGKVTTSAHRNPHIF